MTDARETASVSSQCDVEAPTATALPILKPGDRRIGVGFFTARQLAEMNGLSVSGIQRQLEELALPPAAYAGTGGHAAYLFDADAARENGLVPDVPFNPEREARAGELTTEIDATASPGSLMQKIRSRQGRVLGLNRPATVQELSESGVIRWLGGRWAYNRERVTGLLAPPYDPDREATTAELLAECGHFSNTANLAKAMRGHVKSRCVLDLEGNDRIVWDRAEAVEFFAGRNRAQRKRRDHPLPEQRAPVWRERIGPFALRAPTQRTTVQPADAGWLLTTPVTELKSLLASSPESSVPGEPGISIAWLEAALIDRGDLEGLLFLARVVDGLLVLDAGLDRTTALLRVTEKAA